MIRFGPSKKSALHCMKLLVTHIRNYFGFSELESKGFVPLVIILLFLLISPLFYSWFWFPKQLPQKSELLSLDSLIGKAELMVAEQVASPPTYRPQKTTNNSPKNTSELFSFDPNQADKALLIKLGFQAKVASNLLKYRSRGGVFRKKSDLLKIYGMQASFFERIKPYILLPDAYEAKQKDSGQQFKHQYPDKKNRDVLKVSSINLNQADAPTLRKIWGIGEVLSKRIIKYRDKLGGYLNPNQLKEVYGLKKEARDSLLKYTYFDQNLLRRIPLNEVGYPDLKNHPYLNSKQAQAIVRYRELHGNFKSIKDLAAIKIINSEILNKIAPYLSVSL